MLVNIIHDTLATSAPSKSISYNMHSATTVAACLETILSMPVRSPRLISQLQQVGPNIFRQDRARTLRHPPSTQWPSQKSSQFGLSQSVRGAIVYEGKLIFSWRWT